MQTVWLIIFTALMLIGLIGVFIPAVPGLPWMFAMALIYAIVDHFHHLSPLLLGILGGIALSSVLIDHLSGILGARIGGASQRGMLFGLLGFVIGLIIFPPFGSFIGLFLGVFLAEYYRQKNHERAFKAASSSLIGTVAGIAINFILALLFLGLFLLFALR